MREDTAIYTAYDDHKETDIAEPERNLMRAILKSAMDDMSKRGEALRDALLFFNNPDDSYLFSFRSICNHLDLCPLTIRFLVGLPNKTKYNQKTILSSLAA